MVGPADVVAVSVEPPEGYVQVTCPVCQCGYQTLRQAPAPFCSVRCADAACQPLSPPPDSPRLLQVVQCTYCGEPMEVAPRLRPPYRCMRCAGWATPP
jgi:endogenous inhibitor of DNA gyrase (YacG/DUF329 family)